MHLFQGRSFKVVLDGKEIHMLKIDRQKQHFTRLETPSLADVSISERYDLQEYICNSPEAFFEEIGQSHSS